MNIRRMLGGIAVALAAVVMTGCGQSVEIPPASIGKIMTKDGYQEGLIPPSKFRLAPCMAYCDRLVLLETSDKSYSESLNIFIPKDKLNLQVEVRTTLSPNQTKVGPLFGVLTPQEVDSNLSKISVQSIYDTYARQIILAEVREYLSQYSISEIASSNEKINADIRSRLAEAIEKRTPFAVRYAGITNFTYPQIITDAQEASARRREQIQQEEAQLEVSKVQLERQLQEARLNREIEKEKAETEAVAQRTLAASVDSKVLELKELENQRAWIDRWDGKLPTTSMGQVIPMVQMK